jgi:hypothetical protein
MIFVDKNDAPVAFLDSVVGKLDHAFGLAAAFTTY